MWRGREGREGRIGTRGKNFAIESDQGCGRAPGEDQTGPRKPGLSPHISCHLSQRPQPAPHPSRSTSLWKGSLGGLCSPLGQPPSWAPSRGGGGKCSSLGGWTGQGAGLGLEVLVTQGGAGRVPGGRLGQIHVKGSSAELWQQMGVTDVQDL